MRVVYELGKDQQGQDIVGSREEAAVSWHIHIYHTTTPTTTLSYQTYIYIIIITKKLLREC
jgi:hypothetical protein